MKDYRTLTTGFSIIELMVAMALSLILTLGMTTLFLDSSRTQATVNETSRVQEAGRIVMQLLQGDLRKAGYRGCSTARAVSSSSAALSALHAGITIPADSANLPHQGVDAGSNSLTLTYLRPFPDASSFKVTVAANRTTITLVDANQVLPAISAGRQLVIGNCATQEVIATPQISAGSKSFNITGALEGNYSQGAQLYSIAFRTWYVGSTGRGNNALFINNNELVDNIVVGSFDIIDQNTIPNSYQVSMTFAGSDNPGAVSRLFTGIVSRRNNL